MGTRTLFVRHGSGAWFRTMAGAKSNAASTNGRCNMRIDPEERNLSSADESAIDGRRATEWIINSVEKKKKIKGE